MGPLVPAFALGIPAALKWTGAVAAGTALSSVVSSYAGASMTAAARGAVYSSNRNTQNLIPEPADLLRLLVQRRIGEDTFNALAANHGIPPLATPHGRIWRQVSQSMWARPDVGTLMRAYYRGLFPTTGQDLENFISRELVHHGIQPDTLAARLLKSKPGDYSVGQLLDFRARGLLHDGELERLLKAEGFTLDRDRELIQAIHQGPSESGILELVNRQLISDAEGRNYLSWLGYDRLSEINLMMQLRHAIPGASDLIRFAVREVWDEEVVRRYGYDEEFPEPFAVWMDRVGYGQPLAAVGGDKSKLYELPWAKAYWRAKWQLPSPTQAYDMLHRLRGDPNDRSTWRVPGVRPVTIDNVKDILKVADYPLFWRDALAAISYHPLRLVDIRWAMEAGLQDPDFARSAMSSQDYDLWQRRAREGDSPIATSLREAGVQAWAAEQYQDRGHTAKDASLLAGLQLSRIKAKVNREASKRRATQVARLSRRVLSSYQLGTANRESSIAALTGLGWTAQDAARELTDIDLAEEQKCVAAGLKAVRRAYLKGRVGDDELPLRLAQIGIVAERAGQLAECWRLSRTDEGIRLTTAQILGFVKAGLLDPEDAAERLENLGWTNADALLWLAKTEADIHDRAARRGRAAERAPRREAMDLERLIREEEAALQDMRRRLYAAANPPALVEKLKDGRIGEDSFVRRMGALGYGPDDISQWLSAARASANGSAPAPQA